MMVYYCDEAVLLQIVEQVLALDTMTREAIKLWTTRIMNRLHREAIFRWISSFLPGFATKSLQYEAMDGDVDDDDDDDDDAYFLSSFDETV